jgi:hypothetical protein
MSSSQSAQTDEPPYRSYKELERNHIRVQFSPDAKRLFWPFDGVFPTAISVMKTPRSPEDLEPYFQPDAEAGGTGTWHEISQLPLTEPRVSSVEATISDLDQWESGWMEWHIDHTGDQFSREYVTYGDLNDEDRPYAENAKEDGSWEEDSDTEFLMKCCRQDRPLRKGGKTLLVTPSAGNHFVTVHDYISGKLDF